MSSDFKSGAQTTQRMRELFRELKFSVSHLLRVSFVMLAQVVQRQDSDIQRMNHCPLDDYY